MKPLAVVEVEVVVQAYDRLGDACVIVQVNFFVFDAAPEPLDEDVVQCSTTPIHTDGDLPLFENAGESTARKLDALIRIENLWRCLFQRLMQRARAEIRFQRGRDFPRQHITRVPVHYRCQINKAPVQADIRDVCAPDLIAAVDFQTAQQVRINLMTCAGLRQARLLIDRFQAHQTQQASNSFVIDLMTLRLQPGCHAPNAVERCQRVLLIEQAHQLQVLLALRLRLIIEACARQPDQLALPGKAQAFVRRLNQQPFFFSRTSQLFF